MSKEEENSDSDTSEEKIQSSSKKKSNRLKYILLLANIVAVTLVAYLFHEYGIRKNGEFIFFDAPDGQLGEQDFEEIKVYTDCADYYRAGNTKNGIYEIQPTEIDKFKVYCNMDLGGWTVIMKRNKLKDKTNFNRPMANYKSGFGDLNYNHWLGLNRINVLTHAKPRDLMLYVDDAQYKVHGFKVLDEYQDYKMIVMSEIDAMPNDCSFLRLNNTRFSTNDIDFDLAPDSCSLHSNGEGWWFTNCYDLSIVMTGLNMHSRAGLTKFTEGVMLIK